MSLRTITERDLRVANMVSEATRIDSKAEADFRESATRILLSEQNYEPAGALLVAAFRGLEELGFVDDAATELVKKGLESLGVAVLSSQQ